VSSEWWVAGSHHRPGLTASSRHIQNNYFRTVYTKHPGWGATSLPSTHSRLRLHCSPHIHLASSHSV